ncbi:MAG: glycosyltransferase [Solobacterium sp.]|nr:glycosyltransferase [Solobacterium sp.]
MRIAYINSVAGFGSTGRLVYHLSKTEGVTARIYYGRKKDMTDADTYRMTGFLGNVRHAAMTFLFDRHGFSNTAETKRMLEDLRRFQPDLVHLRNLHGYYVDVETLFAGLKEMGVPVVWTLHDCWSMTGHCAHYDSMCCEGWRTGCQDCRYVNHYPVSWTKRHTAENYIRKKNTFTSLENLTIVTPSQWLADQVKQSYLKDIDTRVIRNGIDLEVFKPTENDFRKLFQIEDKFLILCAASVWTHEKGLHDLVQFSRMLREDECLAVVGIQDNQKEMFPHSTITITRTNSQKEMAEMYTAADVLLNPTLEDTFPTVNIEALACGTPVVTYNTGGSPEIPDEKTGIVVKRGSLSGLRDALDQLRAHPFSAEDCLARAKQFTYSRMLEEYAELYKEKTA